MTTHMLGLLAIVLQAPERDFLLTEGIRLAPMQPAMAVARFEAILAADSGDVSANWRAAVALSDAALPFTTKPTRQTRDSLLVRAQVLARRAVRLAPNDAETLFALGLVLGNTAVTRGSRDKLRMAVEIRNTALLATAADSLHDGAHHLLGRWHFEIMKLSGLERFIAKNILGGGVLGLASWGEARRELELAVRLDSTRIYHRLDFARVLAARKEKTLALAQLRRIAELPDRVAADSMHRRKAMELLAEMTGSEP